MTTKETGGPAFPSENERQTGPNSFHYEGMTLRDYFAAKALIAYHSDGNFSSPEDTANWCYSMADAMLEARK